MYLPIFTIFLFLSALNLLFSPKTEIVVAQSGTATPTLNCIQPSKVDIAFTYCDAAHNDIVQNYSIPLADVSTDKYIPPVILKAMGAQESTWKQCNADNTPFSSTDGCDWGMMQISSGMNCSKPLDQFNAETQQQVKYDNHYNIGMGAHILEEKWNWHQQNNRIIGDGSPNIAEHWYYAVWAYNKWLVTNSPHPDINPCLLWPHSNVDCAYQDKVWWWAAHPLTDNGNALWSAVDLTRPDNLDNFPETPQEMDTWTGWQIDDPLLVHQDSCRDYLPIIMKDWTTVYFFDTFNPINGGWAFYSNHSGRVADHVHVNTNTGHDDNRSLYITEQIDLYSYTSGAQITLNVPPGISPLWLSFWYRRADPTYGGYEVRVDGQVEISHPGSSQSWQLETEEISSHAADGQITLDFRVPSKTGNSHDLLFDEIMISTFQPSQ